MLTLLTLRKQPGVESENVSFSRGLLAKLVLTLFENESNLGFRHVCCQPLKKMNQAMERRILGIDNYSGYVDLRTLYCLLN